MIDAKASKTLKKFTWDEVKKHNRRDDAWVVLEREVDGEKKGLVLDITQWAPRHPGGSIIYDGAGGDCTIMFWCYHPLSFIDSSSSYVNKFVIGEVEDYKCLYNVGSKFYRTLKQRVEAKVSRTARCTDWRMWFKSALILTLVGIFFRLGWMTGNIPAIVLFGMFVSQVAINMMHDGIHHSYSRSPLICSIAGFIFNLAGANYVSYRRAHAFGHHAYTNHDELDSSLLRPFPSLKLHDKLRGKWFHAIQHMYMGIIYMFGALQFWVGDFKEIASLYNYPMRDGPLTLKQCLVIAFGKLFFLGWYVGLQLHWFEWQRALLHMFVFWATVGTCTVVFFAVNHWTDKAVLVTNQELINTTSDWATIQVLSSCNFATESFFWGHVSGGLNLQIEHHLFPSFVHTRLPSIMHIVRDTCVEFGLNYDNQCFPSFWAAVASNMSFIKRIGSQIFTQPPTINIIQGKMKHA